jgi:CBS domain-containing protein
MSARAAWRLESLGFKQAYRYTAGKIDWLASGLPVEGQLADAPCAKDIARTDVPTCRLDERARDVRARVQSDWHVCVVVNAQKIVLGLLREQAMRAAGDATVEQVMEPGPRTYRPYASPDQLMRYFSKHHERDGALVTTADGELIGFVMREDVERAVRDHIKPPAR